MISFEDRDLSNNQLSFKFLSVEDSINDFRLIQRYLQKHFPRIHLTRVTNLNELEPELSINKYDILLLDLYLGLDNSMLQIPQLISSYPRIQIIVVTAEDDIETALACINEGASYIVKGPQLETDLIKVMTYQAKVISSRAILAKTLNDLADSNASLSRFVHHVSLDLKQPLRKITNFISLVDEEIGSTISGNSLKYLQLVKNASG